MQATGTTWKTSVSELVDICRQSLVALTPHMSAAHIPWTELDAYDDWDAIASALYESIVLRSIRWSFPRLVDEIQFPKYDELFVDYGQLSRVEVQPLASFGQGDGFLVFLRFGTEAEPMDTARCVEVNQEGASLGAQLTSIPMEDARFVMRNPLLGVTVDELNVHL